jgi:catechol 2,3-dioxygenase-like lactoylglutathione lyase family enzyme
MIHHVSVGTNNLQKARIFYDPVLGVLGLRLLKQDENSLDYGAAAIIFSVETPVDGKPASVGNGVHLAFVAQNPDIVDEFYRVGLANGGSDAGPPGLRPNYNANYYGAFICDPDGNKIEAVTHAAR